MRDLLILKVLTNRPLGDDYFLVPFQVIRRKFSGAKDSVASSVWRRDYREALELFPDLTLTKLDFSTLHCDACNVRKKSTVAGWLKGIPYDKLSFEVCLFPLISTTLSNYTRSPLSANMTRRTPTTKTTVSPVSALAAFAQFELKFIID